MERLKLTVITTMFPLIVWAYSPGEEPVLEMDNKVAVCHSSNVSQSTLSEGPVRVQVADFFSSLFQTESWPRRWQCGEWSSFHGWFYIASDFFIWTSYFAIPCILFFFLYRRKENLPFKGIFVFFIGFILLCGLTHLIDVLIFWWPAYRLSALIRFGTAIVSMGTVFALIKIVPRALELKSPDALEKVVEERTKELLSLNEKYQQEISERQNAEKELKRLNNLLELRVEEKAKDIISYNEQLAKLNELFESVQSHSHIGIWEFGLQSQRLYLSSETRHIFEYPENHEITIEKIIKQVDDKYRKKLLKAIYLCSERGIKFDFQLTIHTRENNNLWVRVTCIPEYLKNDIVRIKGMVQDIDYLKRNEIELEKSKAHLTEVNEELESFSYTVSHDLRAPLRYIHGHAKILEEDYLDKLDDEGKETIQVIMNNTQKLGQLIDDLLDFSRLGRAEIVYDKCHMGQIIRSVIQDHFPGEIRGNTKLKIKKLYLARADYNMIRHVWMNLISNAIKYSSKKDEIYIEIGSEVVDNEVCYYVKDKGVGFDPAYTHKLFGVFQRLHKVEEFDGTGVGLAIVHRIISRHNGKVWANAQENKGATFYFTLPK